MPSQATIAFTGIPEIIGADIVVTRGARGDLYRILSTYRGNIASNPGTLSLTQDGTTVAFQNCTPDLRTLHTKKVQFRNGLAQKGEFVRSINLWGPRKKWEEQLCTACANIRWRDCTLRGGSTKTAEEIFGELLGVVFATNVSYVNLPTDAYPQAKWDSRGVSEALEWLCKQFAVEICYNGADSISVVALGSGTPVPTGPFNIPPAYRTDTERGARYIQVIPSATLFQDALKLHPVGLDVDGEWKPVDDLSYKPATGWGTEWPTLLSNVAPEHRDLALRTVWRCFQVDDTQSLPTFAGPGQLQSRFQYELDDTLVEMTGTADDRNEIPCYCFGTFWPMSDHAVNSGPGYRHHGPFQIDKQNRIVVFDYPVFRFGSVSQGIIAPELYLYTGFRIREAEKMLYIRTSFFVDRTVGTGVKDLEHPELWETRIQRYSLGQPTGGVVSNNSTIQTEADVYLTAWRAAFDNTTNQADISYAGIRNDIGCNGQIQKVTFTAGYGLSPITRAGQNCDQLGA